MQKDRKMTAPVIYSIAVSSPRGLAAPAARDPPQLARHRGGPRSDGRAIHLLIALTLSNICFIVSSLLFVKLKGDFVKGWK
jgi:hypothetical protein